MMSERSKKKTLNRIKIIGLAFLLGASLTALAGNDNRAPQVPDQIVVDASTNKVHFHGFAVGVQICTWNGSAWTGPLPEATLFDDEGHIVAIHFAGPTWESNSGSQVRGAVIQPTVTVDTNPIPWVRVQAVTTEGPGIFEVTTLIQRVNTTDGRAPSFKRHCGWPGSPRALHSRLLLLPEDERMIPAGCINLRLAWPVEYARTKQQSSEREIKRVL